MMTLEAAKAAVSPYLLLIKLGLVVAVFLSGMWVGCDWKEGKNAKEVQAEKDKATYYYDQAKSLNKDLITLSDTAEANAAQAEKQAELAKKEKERADANKELLRKKQADWEREFEEISNSPDCQKILEQNLCPLIRDY